MSVATLTSKGQVTIPKDIRDALELQTGDRLTFHLQDDGSLEVRPETLDLLALFGVLKPKKHHVSLADMERDIAMEASKR